MMLGKTTLSKNVIKSQRTDTTLTGQLRLFLSRFSYIGEFDYIFPHHVA